MRLILTDTTNDRRICNYYCYDAFGESVISHEDVHNRFRFNGEQYDPVTSQYYLRARFYNPVIGRFTQEDTYYGDGLNLYEYCRNNPVLYRDPSGHDVENQKSLYGKVRFVPTQEQMHNAVIEWSRMEESLANSKTQLSKFNTASVVYDSATGNYYYGMNRGVQLSGEHLNPLLESWLPSKSLNQYRLGNCAEVDVVNQALNNGASVNNLYMYTINTKNNMPKPMCENCVYTFADKIAGILSE